VASRTAVEIGSGGIIDDSVIVGYASDRVDHVPLSIGSEARLRSGTVVYGGSTIGRRLQTGHNVVIREEVRIGDDVGRELPPGEVGEILCRSRFVMAGYWRSPELTAETVREGWLRTGDLGYLDEEGFLYVVDRMKDLIVRDGFNVFPRDVEDALLEHAAVAAAGVVGRPDERHGEEVVAVVALRPGLEASADDLVSFAKARLGAHRYPREVRLVRSLPLTPVGKVDRKLLAEL